MYLNSLELRNFRKFEELHIGFDRQLTVLVGDNGYGKSAVVDAAAIALGTFFMHIPQASQRSIRNTDARVVSRAADAQWCYRPHETPPARQCCEYCADWLGVCA